MTILSWTRYNINIIGLYPPIEHICPMLYMLYALYSMILSSIEIILKKCLYYIYLLYLQNEILNDFIVLLNIFILRLQKEILNDFIVNRDYFEEMSLIYLHIVFTK